MINALHLIWIIPISACVGFITAALLSAADRHANTPFESNKQQKSENGLSIDSKEES